MRSVDFEFDPARRVFCGIQKGTGLTSTNFNQPMTDYEAMMINDPPMFRRPEPKMPDLFEDRYDPLKKKKSFLIDDEFSAYLDRRKR
jgi:hypothetical protein